VRETVKKISKWPTYPQLYVDGNLVGGIDVCTELDDENELEDALVGN
jgi:monothiol glutaredoxin